MSRDVDYRAEDLPTGSFVKRTYLGKTHVVFIHPTPDTKNAHRKWWRYVYRDVLYKTLSGVAREITGDASMSGNRFFRLRRRRR